MSVWYEGEGEIACSLDRVAQAIGNNTGEYVRSRGAAPLVVRDVTAPGLLGFFYRRFGSSKIGKALLAAEKTYFETSTG